MSTLRSHTGSFSARCPRFRGFVSASAILWPIVLLAGAAQAQDGTWEMREWAKTWAMHKIAVIQAAAGDVLGAKRTVSQIGDEGEGRASDVTAVWFCNGQPIYDHPPVSACGGNCSTRTVWQSLNRERSADRVPSQVPPGLPSNYFAPDPRHGTLVDFADESDSRGTRVTARRYADGYAVIETPRLSGQ